MKLTMIIPKARFLKQAWQKNQADLINRLNNEHQRVMSRLVNALRLPQNHRLGALSVYLPAEEYPLLMNGAGPEILAILRRDFEHEGYRVETARDGAGLTVRLDWTGGPDDGEEDNTRGEITHEWAVYRTAEADDDSEPATAGDPQLRPSVVQEQDDGESDSAEPELRARGRADG